MRTILKSSAILLTLFAYSLVSLCLVILPAGRRGRRVLLMRNTTYFSRLALRLLGIRVLHRARGQHPVTRESCMVVANHLSYVDILILAALRPAVFITSIELRNTFPLGVLAWLGGSIFVERRSPLGLKREIRAIERVLRDGHTVVLFAEGTTSDGQTVQPFRNSLFSAAIAAGVPVLPLCLRYRRINGRKLAPHNRDAVFYYGGVSFPVHAPKLLSLRSVHVECALFGPIATHDVRSRKDLAAQCHQIIKQEYHRSP